jgi:hypothetical protein
MYLPLHYYSPELSIVDALPRQSFGQCVFDATSTGGRKMPME